MVTSLRLVLAVSLSMVLSAILLSPVSCQEQQKQQHLRTAARELGEPRAIDPNLHDAGLLKSFEHKLEDIHQEHKDAKSRDKNNLTAVIHIGPQKTGSTSIQVKMNDMADELKQDYWVKMPDVNYLASFSFGGCFWKGKNDHTRERRRLTGTNNHRDLQGIDYECHPENLDEAKRLASQEGMNLIITSETLANVLVDHEKLAKWIAPTWNNVRVVAYYRRFYSWLISLHNQQVKGDAPDSRRFDLVEFLTIERMEMIYQTYYITAAINEFTNHFAGNAEFKLYNLHNNSDATESFFCDALPSAPHTCDVFKEQKEREMKAVDTNKGKDLIYLDLVYYAQEMGLLKTRYTTKEEQQILADQAKVFQEQTLGKSKYDWYTKKCPSDDILDWLLAKSLETEQSLFPEYYRTTGEAEMREQFQKYKKTKLCTIPAKPILENEVQWQNFFKSL